MQLVDRAVRFGRFAGLLARLPAGTRQADKRDQVDRGLLLRLYVGLSEAETGEVLAIPPRAVKKQAEHGLREVAAAGETALGAGWRPVPMGVLAQELTCRLRDVLDQLDAA